jgi:N-formylglutamate amidohydrolase
MSKTKTIWHIEYGDGPIAACAIHDGHDVRPELAACLRLSEAERLYEEDPYTACWTDIAPTRLVMKRSRFEVDLNRPRDKAVYMTPADAWGLTVWTCPLNEDVVRDSLRLYDDFYAQLRLILNQLVARHTRVVLFDLHTYNHLREGQDRGSADPDQNPEINLGTGTMNRPRWAAVVERWLAEIRAFDYFGRRLDVRENVKFFGGNLPAWIHQEFPESVCALAIEVKKFFMDEWTGKLDARQHEAIGAALAVAAQGVTEVLETKSP